MRVFITGISGFIGFHVAAALAKQGVEIFGIDNFNAYYDPQLKYKRANLLEGMGVEIIKMDLNDPVLKKEIQKREPTHILHLAAQAGVRYSLHNPHAYVEANIQGFMHLLEILKETPSIPIIYASSSSVYGRNAELPFSIKNPTDQPASFYAMTKKAGELMASTYSHLYGLRTVGLRYFTVYGPWGRPDMALFGFTKAILEDKPIDLYNFGNMLRDFTYIDDIVSGTLAALHYKGSQTLFNLGNHSPVTLLRFVEILEEALGKKAIRNLLPLQQGDMLATYADISESKEGLGFTPKTSLEEGIRHFVNWYKLEYCEGGDLNPYRISPTTTSK